MKKLLLSFLICGVSFASMAEVVTLEGKDYEVQRLIDRQIGPGIQHTRFRLPSYPLNINVVKVDLTNPYNRIETTIANESAKGTELLVNAAKRQSYPSHRALAGANANFWVVATQPEEKTYTGTTRNVSLRNGKMVTESNQHRDQWDGGTMRTGIVGVSYDKQLYIDRCVSTIEVSAPAIGTLTVHQCNKGIHPDELCMYNSLYGTTRQFMPICQDEKGKYQHDEGGDATEILLDMQEGEGWNSGRDIKFTVKEIRTDAGKGTLGSHDLALVGRGQNQTDIAKLSVGDEVVLKYTWTFNPGTDKEVTPLIENAIGGNALVMVDGVLTEHNTNESYNSQVYSRTGYGCSADGKTLYIVVIDKSTDPTYGASSGCNTTKMCEFARYLGCSNMANFDAGGSAEMFITDHIENRTTEGSPRAVANGWFVYSTAPEDAADFNEIAELRFSQTTDFESPIYASFTPSVIAYNRYGSVLDYDFQDFTISCSEGLGSCDGSTFTASGTPGSGLLTATYGDISVSHNISTMAAEISLRIKPLLIDGSREYPIEVFAIANKTNYPCNPANLEWEIEDPSIVEIDQNGVLRGLKEGTTTITGKIGEFQESTQVTVEIAPTAEIAQENWEGWTIKRSSGLSKEAFTADGLATFEYGSPRGPYITITKETYFYSIPDAIYLEVTPSVALSDVSVDFRAANMAKANLVEIKPTEGEVFEAGKTHLVEIPLSSLGDPSDLALYPVKINYIRPHIKADASYKGSQSIQFGKLYAVYSHYNSGIEETIAGQGQKRIVISPNPLMPGERFTVKAENIETIEIYTPAGIRISSSNGNSSIAPSTPGSYIVRVLAGSESHASVIIVK